MYFCLLCKQSANESYNIYTTNVFDNSKLLITVLEEVTNNKSLQRTGNEICVKCHHLLNELHGYQIKIKEISDKLKFYLTLHSFDEDINIVENHSQSSLKKLEKTEIIKQNKEKIHYKCKVCFKLFLSKNGVARHLKKQHAETNCEEVESIVTAVNLQEKSYEVVEKNSKSLMIQKPKKYQCNSCPKKFKTSGELKHHLQSHSNVKPFICEICGQCYKHKSALDVHVGLHNGVSPFTCVYCKKSFTQKGALRRHIPIHTGDIFICISSDVFIKIFSNLS